MLVGNIVWNDKLSTRYVKHYVCCFSVTFSSSIGFYFSCFCFFFFGWKGKGFNCVKFVVSTSKWCIIFCLLLGMNRCPSLLLWLFCDTKERSQKVNVCYQPTLSKGSERISFKLGSRLKIESHKDRHRDSSLCFCTLSGASFCFQWDHAMPYLTIFRNLFRFLFSSKSIKICHNRNRGAG